MKSVYLTVLAAAAALTLSACSSVDLDKDNKDLAAGGDMDAVQRALNDPNGELARKEVHFDFDSYSVNQNEMPTVQHHSRFLNANRNLTVTLEGNTDERGGREYNLALGQKRAEAVKSRMTMLGVNPDQIETVSFGKEKPRSLGHDETSYADNRRVDIRYNINR